MNIGIDASNTASGGLLTHLSQLLKAADPERYSISQVIVWGAKATLDALENRPWLQKVHVRALDGSLLRRFAWQQTRLPSALREARCSLLLSPGGTLPLWSHVAAVSISQHLLPFEPEESARLGIGWRRLKIALLRRAHARSFRAARGVIFLTEHARRTVLRAAGAPHVNSAIIAHGIEPRFFVDLKTRQEPRPSETFRLLYVSRVDAYKHQWVVADAVARVRARGLPVQIDFVGPAYRPALAKLLARCRALDPLDEFLHYRGFLQFAELHEVYRRADAFVFASSCESLPNTLIEVMAAGLPMACSNAGSMPEVVGDAAVYFTPTDVGDTAAALERLVRDEQLRVTLAANGRARARRYSWTRCADETFEFISRFLPGPNPRSAREPHDAAVP